MNAYPTGGLAVTADGLRQWHEAVEALAAGTLQAAATPRRPLVEKGEAGVAVIPVQGVLTPKPTLLSRAMNWSDIATLRANLAEALRSGAETIALLVDSPGGSVFGIEEAAADVYAARRRARIVAYIDGLGASAAFWLASQAHEVVATPSALVGSIGVLATHLDHSRALERDGIKPTIIQSVPHKKEGTALEPLSDEAHRHLQSEVAAYHAVFVANVARGRGVTPAHVEANYGQGRVLTAREALARGMTDRVALNLTTALRPPGAVLTRDRAAAHIALARAAAMGTNVLALAPKRDHALERAERVLRESQKFMEAEEAIAAALRKSRG